MAGTEKPKGAKAELVDLDVNEVSIVDRPANKRRFLITKQVDGEISLEVEEIQMNGEVDGNVTILDLLEKDAGAATDERPAEQPLEEVPIEVEKSTKDLLQELNEVAVLAKSDGIESVVDKLQVLAEVFEQTALDGGGTSLGVEKSEAADLIMEAVACVTESITTFENNHIEKTLRKESSADLLATASTAIVKAIGVSLDDLEKWPVAKGKNLAAIMNRTIDAKSNTRFERADLVKRLATSVNLTPSTITQILRAEITCATKPQLTKFAGVLGVAPQTLINAAVRDGCRFELSKDDTQDGDDIECFTKTCSTCDTDPEILLKAGAAMKRTRLSEFRKAVERLNAILKELEGDDMDDVKKDVQQPTSEAPAVEAPTAKPTEETQTTVTPQVVDIAKAVSDAIGPALEALEKKISEQIKTAVQPVSDGLAAVQKRVDGIEETNPGGTELEPGETTATRKGADPLNWGSILR